MRVEVVVVEKASLYRILNKILKSRYIIHVAALFLHIS